MLNITEKIQLSAEEREERKEKIILKVMHKYYDEDKDFMEKNRALMFVCEVLGELNLYEKI